MLNFYSVVSKEQHLQNESQRVRVPVAAKKPVPPKRKPGRPRKEKPVVASDAGVDGDASAAARKAAVGAKDAVKNVVYSEQSKQMAVKLARSFGPAGRSAAVRQLKKDHPETFGSLTEGNVRYWDINMGGIPRDYSDKTKRAATVSAPGLPGRKKGRPTLMPPVVMDRLKEATMQLLETKTHMNCKLLLVYSWPSGSA
jgi:hypothetical protein